MLRRKIYILSRETFQVAHIVSSKLSGSGQINNLPVISSIGQYTLGIFISTQECSPNVRVRRNGIHTSLNKRTVFSKQRILRERKCAPTHAHTCQYIHVPHRNTSLQRWRRPDWSKDPADTPLSTFWRSLWIRDQFRHVWTRRALQKGTKHKSRIINLQGKHEPTYISSIVHRLCEASRSEISARFFRDRPLNTSKDKNKLLKNILNPSFLDLYIRFDWK